MDRGRGPGHSVDRGITVIPYASTRGLNPRFDKLAGIHIVNINHGDIALRFDQSCFQCKWTNARQHVAAIRRRINLPFTDIHLRKQVIDIGAGFGGAADDGNFAGQRMATANSIDLQLVS